MTTWFSWKESFWFYSPTSCCKYLNKNITQLVKWLQFTLNSNSPNEFRRCRSCWGWPGSSRWHLLVAIRGYLAVELRFLRSLTNHFDDDLLLQLTSVIQKSRTIRWLRLAASQGDRILWNHRDVHLSKCTFARSEIEFQWKRNWSHLFCYRE